MSKALQFLILLSSLLLAIPAVILLIPTIVLYLMADGIQEYRDNTNK